MSTFFFFSPLYTYFIGCACVCARVLSPKHVSTIVRRDVSPFRPSLTSHLPPFFPTTTTNKTNDATKKKQSSNGTTLALKYVNNKSLEIAQEAPDEGASSSFSSILSVHSSLDADGANTAVFNITLHNAQEARALLGGVQQAARAMLLRLEDALSEASAEAGEHNQGVHCNWLQYYHSFFHTHHNAL